LLRDKTVPFNRSGTPPHCNEIVFSFSRLWRDPANGGGKTIPFPSLYSGFPSVTTTQARFRICYGST